MRSKLCGVELAGSVLTNSEGRGASDNVLRTCRDSGKVLTAEQAKASTSKYIVEVSKGIFLCAEDESEWEGRSFNCARKAQIPMNAKFAADGILYWCPVSKKHYIKIFAEGDSKTTNEMVVDYGAPFWRETGTSSEGEDLPTPKSNYHSPRRDEKHRRHVPLWSIHMRGH